MHLSSRRTIACFCALLACLTGAGIAAGLSSGSADARRTVGDCPTGGLGDPFHPSVGIPGVKVRSTEAHLDIAEGAVSYTAETRLALTATRPLRCAVIDFARGKVLGAEVDGQDSTWKTRPQKVIVDLGHNVARGTRFEVTVRTHTVVPKRPTIAGFFNQDFPPGVYRHARIMSTIGEPARDHYLVPMADHPAQKAPWRVVVDVPRHDALAFGGRLISVKRLDDGRRRFVAATGVPIGPMVLQLAVARRRWARAPPVDGVRLRSYLPIGTVGRSRRGLALLPGEIRTMTRLLGRFPFREYGLLATPYGGDLEDQTLTLTSIGNLHGVRYSTSTLFHELVHEWFGDSVSVERWADLWLAEGHADYYEDVYGHPYDEATEKQYKTVDRAFWEEEYETAQEAVDRDGPVAAPRVGAFRGPARPLAPYGGNVYHGGAVALYALRTRVGEARFNRIERTFVHRYRNGNASTRDYLRIVGGVAGAATRSWFARWLYDVDLPPLPPA